MCPLRLPAAVVSSRFMGCGHLWDEEAIVFGCAKGDPNWWAINTSVDPIEIGPPTGSCGFNSASNFRNLDNATLIASGNTRHIHKFTASNGWERFTTSDTRLVQSHAQGQGFTLPAATIPCSD